MAAWTFHRPVRRSAELAAAIPYAGAENENDRGIATPTSETWESPVPCTHTTPIRLPAVIPAWLNADEIEQRIIRAYLHLAFDPTERNGSRVVTIARAGMLEARLSEIPPPGPALGLPQFWLEIYSHATQTVIDSRGCHDFDEYELLAAVKMVTSSLACNRPPH